MTRSTNPEAVGPELVERMLALVRQIGGGFWLNGVNEDGITPYDAVEAARTIVAELPEPDPDLIEARKIASEKLWKLGASAEAIAAGDISEGKGDDKIIMHAVLAAIKRGRQLAESPK